jgi:hypothetical protein
MNDLRTVARAARNESGRHRRVGRRLVVTTCMGLALVLGSVARHSGAQTTMQLIRWREFSYAKETKTTGGPMTALEAVNRTGFIVLGDGQFARLSSWIVQTTSPDAKEFYNGFIMYDFSDGSSILAKVDAAGPPRLATVTAGPDAKQVGTITFVAGTKRFKGIAGRGTLTSWIPSQGDMYAEIDATYTVSEP